MTEESKVTLDGLGATSSVSSDSLFLVRKGLEDFKVTSGNASNFLTKDEGIIKDSFFDYWPTSRAISTAAHPILCNVGGFAIRSNSTSDCTVYKLEDGARFQRNNADTKTDSLHYIIPLSSQETMNLRGQTIYAQIEARKSSTFTGGDITFRMIYSEEPSQPVRLDTGQYASGNQTLGTTDISLSTSYPSSLNAISGTVPLRAVNMAFVVDIPFVGTAGTDDYIEIKSIHANSGGLGFSHKRLSAQELSDFALERYQSSYPVGSSYEAITTTGALMAIATNDFTNYGAVASIQFDKGFNGVPTGYVYADKDAQDMEIYSALQDDSVNALAFGISTAGMRVTNNASLTPGDTVSFHYAAILRA